MLEQPVKRYFRNQKTFQWDAYWPPVDRSKGKAPLGIR